MDKGSTTSHSEVIDTPHVIVTCGTNKGLPGIGCHLGIERNLTKEELFTALMGIMQAINALVDEITRQEKDYQGDTRQH